MIKYIVATNDLPPRRPKKTLSRLSKSLMRVCLQALTADLSGAIVILVAIPDPGLREKEVAHNEVVSMRRLSCLVALSFLALLVVVPVAGAHQPQDMMGQSTTPKMWKVSIEDFQFDPAEVAIQPGDTIMWVNEGNTPHTVTSDDGQFDSEVLNPGESFMFTFPEAGTFNYHCEIHPFMTGSVTVGAAAGGGGGTPMQQPADPTGGNMSMGSMGAY
jgi:plastocyanin